MLAASERELPRDIAIFTAAVADWRLAREKSEDQERPEWHSDLQFVEIRYPATMLRRRSADTGCWFAAETENL
jgi:hypothetical protein